MTNRKFAEQLTGRKPPKASAPVVESEHVGKGGWERLIEVADKADLDKLIHRLAVREAYDLKKVEREGLKKKRKAMAKHKGRPIGEKRRRGAVAGMAESRAVRVRESCTLATRHICNCKRCIGR